jgi:NitT/TauT family transport system ATP-binding protein
MAFFPNPHGLSKTAVSGVGISIQNLSFAFTEDPLFQNLSLELGDESPAVILGASGCGKTTMLRLMAGLLKPQAGTVRIGGPMSFVFQEDRLLPWYTALENVCLPMEGKGRSGSVGPMALGPTGTLDKQEVRDRGMHFLRLVSMEDKAASYPGELSGGQARRISIARAFAYPAPYILMDEPFQSLDIPLRIQLMDMVLDLLETEKRIAVVVTHDPREAVYLGRRVLVLGNSPQGVIFDQRIDLSPEDRAYGGVAQARLERVLLDLLGK